MLIKHKRALRHCRPRLVLKFAFSLHDTTQHVSVFGESVIKSSSNEPSAVLMEVDSLCPVRTVTAPGRESCFSYSASQTIRW